MSTADDAVEAGARALDSSYNPEQHPIMAAMFGDYSLTAARAQWPVLSAPLRELHKPFIVDGCSTCSHCVSEDDQDYGAAWPCPTVRELDRIDKELGL